MSNYTFAYYIPFYFQAVQGVSATTSGIRFIPLALPEVAAIVLSGALVSATGHYVPFMILSSIVGAVGSGLLTLLTPTTPTVQWAAYLVIAGFGLGIGLQLPFTIVQVELSENDVPIGNAITVFFTQLGGAISISIAQTIFLNGLIKEVPKSAKMVSPQEVFNVGPTNLASLTQDPQILQALRGAYSKAIVDIFYYALGTVSIALPFAIATEWKNVKKISAQREDATRESGTREKDQVVDTL